MAVTSPAEYDSLDYPAAIRNGVLGPPAGATVADFLTGVTAAASGHP